jgi:hypothetical protein
MKNKKFIGLFILIALFTLVTLKPSRANAYGLNYSKFYVGINGGIASTSLGNGLSTKSRGTYNLTIGDNYHMNNVVIGGGALLGYASDGSYSGSGYSFNVNSVYYGAFVKGGYNYENFTPFVKVGYIGYSYSISNNNNYSYSIGSEGGVLYGVGVKYSFTSNWGVTAQYMGASLSSSYKENNYLIGIDYSF